jgi:hypothetical protein
VKLYTGNGGTQTISGLGFSPDLVWLKARNNNFVNGLFDTVRGPSRFLVSNSTVAELVNEVDGYLSAFTSDGFTLSPGTSSSNTFNSNAGTQVAWTWDAGSSTVTNTQGSITSQVRANASAGFSVVTWTGTGTAGTIGHGLGVAPGMIIVKARSTADAWYVYHSSLGATKRIQLNETSAETAGTSVWNSTSPTSTVFSIGNGNPNSSGVTYVAYVFSPVVGYSAALSWAGNGDSNGIFLYCGFRPRFILIKMTNSTESWVMVDTARNPYNVSTNYLFANSSNAEGTATLYDILSNGIKFRSTAQNDSGAQYVAFAWAESPFQYARAR